jgi:peptidyl-prolyl cis-trans isomerase SurA
MTMSLRQSGRPLSHATRLSRTAGLLCVVLGLVFGTGLTWTSGGGQSWLSPRSAQAQDIQRIAAVVNDDIVSIQDLRERIRMVVVTSGLPNSPEVAQRLAPTVLRTLIDEQLQLQEAKRLNISVGDEELAQTRSVVEQRNNLRPGQLDVFLRQLGIAPDTVERQQRAGIAWGSAVRRRYGSDVAVSTEEVEEELARIRAQAGKTQTRLYEILLTIDKPEDEPRVLDLARRLVSEIRGGAAFDSVARQFSQAASASAGGDIGWILPETMSDEIQPVIANMTKGQVSDPIRTVFGYQILAVADERVIQAADPATAKVDLMQVFLPVARDADASARQAQRSLADAVAATARDCSDMATLAEEVKSPVDPDMSDTAVSSLPEALRGPVAALQPGQTSEPIDLPNGVMVVMLCSRAAGGTDDAEFEQVRRQLETRRFEILAQRYLRDLRRNAFVDVRV